MMKSIVKFFLRNVPRRHLHRISHFVFFIISPFYAGNRFEDPITGRTYRKLLPYGRTNPRENALAPHSMSLERHRMTWLYLKERTNFFSANLKVLHVAPEHCFLTRFKKLDNLDYISADLNSPWADIHMDVHDIPFEDETFDVVIANHLLEHVENDKKVLSEFFRVLKPGGWGILLVPMIVDMEKTYEDPTITSPEEREKHFKQNDHYRIYGRDYPERLRSVGFEAIEEDFVSTYPEELRERYCLPKEDLMYQVTRPAVAVHT